MRGEPLESSTVLDRKDEILGPLDPTRYTTLMRLVTDPQMRLVVAFGGGSVPGLCGNTALARILEELGIKPHVEQVWGTSAGAAVGGPWASGSNAQRIFDCIAGLDRRGSVDISWFKLAFSLMLKPFGTRLPDGLIKGRHFSAAIEAAFSKHTFEECEIPFRCIACTDDGNATRKIFRRGPLLPAIFSSMSIPGIVFPRPRLAGEKTGFYDGGLVEKTPLISPIAEHHRDHPKRTLLLLGSHYTNEVKQTAARGFLLRFLQTINALEDLAWHYQIREAREKSGVELLILNPRIDDPSLFDFSRVERNYLHAREVLADTLQNAKLALSFGLR
ncbi:MAG: hypothetical protein CMJ83_12895 [Planctomycetes bacterium]|nr:hypothetical protein [Planctomycetota bacterium]